MPSRASCRAVTATTPARPHIDTAPPIPAGPSHNRHSVAHVHAASAMSQRIQPPAAVSGPQHKHVRTAREAALAMLPLTQRARGPRGCQTRPRLPKRSAVAVHVSGLLLGQNASSHHMRGVAPHCDVPSNRVHAFARTRLSAGQSRLIACAQIAGRMPRDAPWSWCAFLVLRITPPSILPPLCFQSWV